MKTSTVVAIGLGTVGLLGLGALVWYVTTASLIEQVIASESIEAQRAARAIASAWKAGVRDPEQLEQVTMKVVLSGEDLRQFEEDPEADWAENVSVTRTNVRNLIDRAVPMLEGA